MATKNEKKDTKTTGNQPQSAVADLEKPVAQDRPETADDGGLLMSDESNIPVRDTTERDARTDHAGGLLMSKEVDVKTKKKDDGERGVPANVDIKPDFTSLNEDDILAEMRNVTKWLRDRGATVRGPKVEETDDGAEAFYEFEYNPKDPVTVRNVGTDRLEALRATAHEAFARRYEV